MSRAVYVDQMFLQEGEGKWDFHLCWFLDGILMKSITSRKRLYSEMSWEGSFWCRRRCLCHSSYILSLGRSSVFSIFQYFYLCFFARCETAVTSFFSFFFFFWCLFPFLSPEAHF